MAKKNWKSGDIVEVYKNLHTGLWSVRDPRTKRVIGHTDQIFLREVDFTVQRGGRDRARRDKQRNVHAWVRGRVTTKPGKGQAHEFTYNPFIYNSFVYRDDHSPIWQSHRVELRKDGRAYSVE